uniref:Uncharacterized protein n=1 Tax=Salix viminalis TaxID=40686 RepID=A0A6N2JXR1_SALVM
MIPHNCISPTLNVSSSSDIFIGDPTIIPSGTNECSGFGVPKRGARKDEQKMRKMFAAENANDSGSKKGSLVRGERNP